MQKRSSGGCGSFLFLLFFLFLALKLTDAVDWSWWWVTSPLWLPAALGLVLVLGLSVAGVSIYKLVTKLLKKKVPQSGAGSPRADVIDGDVVEAEGSEVRPNTSARLAPQALPAASADAQSSADTPATGGDAPSS
jgi:hypothetical protein